MHHHDPRHAEQNRSDNAPEDVTSSHVHLNQVHQIGFPRTAAEHPKQQAVDKRTEESETELKSKSQVVKPEQMGEVLDELFQDCLIVS